MKFLAVLIGCVLFIAQQARAQLVNFTGGNNYETLSPGGPGTNLYIGPQYNGDSSGYGVPPDEVTVREVCTESATSFDLRMSFSLQVSPTGQVSESGLQINPSLQFNVASGSTFSVTGSMTEAGDATLSMSYTLSDVPSYANVASQVASSNSPNSTLSFTPRSGVLLASSTGHSYLFRQSAFAQAPTNSNTSDQTTVTGYYDLAITTAPEPSAIALASIGGSTLLLRRRRFNGGF